MSDKKELTIVTYYSNHRKERAAYAKAWRVTHKKEIAARNKNWAMAHREEINARARTQYAARKKNGLPPRNRAWRATHRKEILVARRLEKYGLSASAFEAMLLAQDGVCAACGSSNWGHVHGPRVDHDHDNGKVRGILCHGCNVAAGYLGDNPTRARKLADYLERT